MLETVKNGFSPPKHLRSIKTVHFLFCASVDASSAKCKFYGETSDRSMLSTHENISNKLTKRFYVRCMKDTMVADLADLKNANTI